ncbi:MAG: hypothetical protein LAT81_05605, partial [Oceanicaulis sp.]|nr:hypothetical protein [Oceanicaulis sp.]
MMTLSRLIAAFSAAMILTACGGEPEGRDTSEFDREYQSVLHEALLDAQPGDVIEIPAGRFAFDRGLSLSGVSGVTIRGAGMEETILSFAGQRQGAEGLLVSNSDNFTIENLAVEDTAGDAIKITGGDGVVIRGVRVEWPRGPATETGAYGLDPVLSRQVLIEAS